jgi:hypothetical protein
MTMTHSKNNQNAQFAELFDVLIDGFGPMLVDAGARFLNERSQHSAAGDDQDQRAERGTSDEHETSRRRAHTAPRQSPDATSTGTDDQQRATQTEESDEADHTDDANYFAGANHSEGSSYADAGAFEQQTTGHVRGVIMTLATNGDVLGAMKDLIAEAGEVRKFEEVQQTQRADIAARRDIAIANIEAQRAAIQTYLDKSFDERKENFSKLFAVIDHALATNNMQELAISLQGVLTLAQSSPFKDLETVEATAAALADPDHEWDF